MRYFLFFILLFLINKSFAQESLDKSLIQLGGPVFYTGLDISENLEIDDMTEDAKLYAVSTGEGYFQRTYLVDKKGNSISDGFMPRAYFMPNDNFIVITAQGNMVKDSFNPYGAYDMPSMLILGTFNNFISRFSKHRR